VRQIRWRWGAGQCSGVRQGPGTWLHCWLHGERLPVVLAAALPLAVSAVSGLAKRPRSGLALTQRTRPRSSCSEEDEPQPGRSVVRESAYQERHSCWPAGVGCS
jgi:hypothetical protein